MEQEEKKWIYGLKTCLVPFLPLLVNLSLYSEFTSSRVLSTFVVFVEDCLVKFLGSGSRLEVLSLTHMVWGLKM